MAPIKETRARPASPPPIVSAPVSAAVVTPTVPVANTTGAKPSGFDARQKRKVSITGGHRAPTFKLPTQDDLSDQIAAQRRAVHAGATPVGNAPRGSPEAKLAGDKNFRSLPPATQTEVLKQVKAHGAGAQAATLATSPGFGKMTLAEQLHSLKGMNAHPFDKKLAGEFAALGNSPAFRGLPDATSSLALERMGTAGGGSAIPLFVTQQGFTKESQARQTLLLNTLAEAPLATTPKARPVPTPAPERFSVGPMTPNDGKFRYKGGPFVTVEVERTNLPTASTAGSIVPFSETPGATGKTIGAFDARVRKDYVDRGIQLAQAMPNLMDLNIRTIHFKYSDGRTLDVPFDQISFPGDPVRQPARFEKVDGRVFPIDAQGKRIFDVENTPSIVESAMTLVDQATERKQVRMEIAEMVAPFAASVAMLGGWSSFTSAIKNRPFLGKPRAPSASRPSASATATISKRTGSNPAVKPTVVAKPTVIVKPATPAKPKPVQLDVNLVARLLNPKDPKSTPAESAAALAYVQANKASGLTINRHAYQKLLNSYSKEQIKQISDKHGIKLARETQLPELGKVAKRIEGAFDGTTRVISKEDARIAATAYLRKERIATGDLQFYKRARDLGLQVDFVGAGRSAALAAAYVPTPVTVPK